MILRLIHSGITWPKIILAVCWLLLIAGQPLGAQPGQPEEAVIPVFATYPKKSATLFVNELRVQLNRMQTGSVCTTGPLYTMGDENTAGELIQELQSNKILLCIYLDASSARLISPKIRAPGLALIPTIRLLNADKEGSLLGLGDRTAVLETQPDMGQLAAALKHLTPRPPGLGLVDPRYNPQANVLLKGLQKIWPAAKLSGVSAPITVCMPNGAACENHNAMRLALQRDLSRLKKGSLLLVIPDTNTLKFAFVLRQFAEEQQLGLIGYGDFNPGGELLRIFNTPQQLAGICADTIHNYAKNPVGKPRIAKQSIPQVTFNAQIGKALGYVFTSPPTLQKKSESSGGSRLEQ